jgi:hypothetical protein
VLRLQPKFASDGSIVPQESRFYFYKTPVLLKSMMGLEHAAITAMCKLASIRQYNLFTHLGHISGRDNNFLNQQLNSVPEGDNLRKAMPKDLIYLGMYIIRQLSINFKSDIQSG